MARLFMCCRCGQGFFTERTYGPPSKYCPLCRPDVLRERSRRLVRAWRARKSEAKTENLASIALVMAGRAAGKRERPSRDELEAALLAYSAIFLREYPILAKHMAELMERGGEK